MEDINKQFNEQSKLFYNEIEKLFPNDETIKTNRIMFDRIRILDNKKPASIFMETLRPYGTHIFSRDEIFFKSNFAKVIGLSDHWDHIDGKNKEVIWSYLQILYVMGMKILNAEDELNNILGSL